MSTNERNELEQKLKEERKRQLERGIVAKRNWIAEERLRSHRAFLPPHEKLLVHMERQLREIGEAA